MKVLVVTAGGLRLAHVGCYGNDWIETPALDRLAAEGIVFDQHFADCPDAVGARRSWQTGCYHFPTPDAHTCDRPPEHDLIRLLGSAGIATFLLTKPHCAPPADLRDTWQQVVAIPDVTGEAPVWDGPMQSITGVLKRLKKVPSWLVWVDLATLLPPWQAPAEILGLYFSAAETAEEEGETEESEQAPLADPVCGALNAADDVLFDRLQRSYAAVVTFFDAGLGRLLGELDRRLGTDEVCVVLTSDRGLPLGEHGILGEHRPWLHDELVHLPLIVRLPGSAEAGRRIAALTQPVDLLPTLLELFGLSAAPVHGHSLLPLARGVWDRVRAYACSGHRIGDEIEWAIRSPEWAFLLPVLPTGAARQPQLYVKPDDRWEVNNLLQHHPELAENLEKTLRGFVAATRQPGPLQAPELQTALPVLQTGEKQ